MIEQKGFRLVAMKFLRASEEHLKQHYIDLKDRPFFPGLVKYMNSGPVVAMVSACACEGLRWADTLVFLFWDWLLPCGPDRPGTLYLFSSEILDWQELANYVFGR